jgi:adenine phosphoribosyltransferase
MEDSELDFIKERIKCLPDYPKKGVLFRDITPLLKSGKAFSLCIEGLANQVRSKKIDYVAGVEARGFIIGSALALKLGVGFIPLRKPGHLPRGKISVKYEVEYGKSEIEIHEDAIEKGSRVLIVDDLMAAGGTAEAAASLIERLGGKVAGFAFIIELVDMAGRQRLKNYEVISLIKY